MSKKRSYVKYLEASLNAAVEGIRSGEISINEAARIYSIPRGTLQNKIRGLHNLSFGRQTAFTKEEEEMMVTYVLICSQWGFPMTKLDVRFLAKSYLDKLERNISKFKNNLPGPHWIDKFVDRHQEVLSQRLANNIKRSRANISREVLQKYFENLEKEVQGVPPCNIFNYDETNFQDDPKNKKVLAKRGTKYVDRVMNSTKTSISVMFAGSADGTILPPYVVYKAANMWTSWAKDGPQRFPLCENRQCCRKGSRFNRTSHGWFDSSTFTDWFKTCLLPHLHTLQGPKVVIGDNLSSHFTTEILNLCKDNDIRFVCLPPNSTHLCQPLDVAFFAPLKKAWRQILEEYKRSHSKAESLQKSDFPGLLKKILAGIGNQCKSNMESGFKACGIYPFDPTRVINKVPGSIENKENNFHESALSTSVLEVLKTMRYDKNPNAKSLKKKKIQVEPGRSVVTLLHSDSEPES